MSNFLARTNVLLRVALGDLAHSWRGSSCLAFGAAAALAPVLVLFGLNFGFVNGLIEELRMDPATRELRPVGQHQIQQAWFDALAGDPRVSFLLPRTRYLTASGAVRGPGGLVDDIELVPSASGDPIIGEASSSIDDDCRAIVVTESVAQAGGFAVGDTATLVIRRAIDESPRLARGDYMIAAIVPRGAFERNAAFVPVALLDRVERWREGHQTSENPLDCAEGPARSESYSSFRLYARDVRDVVALRSQLVAEGFDVRTRAEEITRALAIEKGLGWLFVTILALSAIGFATTLGLHLAAAVIEKSRDLAILRLLGMRRLEVSALPLIQGAVIALGGASAAALGVYAGQPAVNSALAGVAGFSGDVSRLEPIHIAAAIAVSTLVGAASGVAAGMQAARMSPSEGLRRE